MSTISEPYTTGGGADKPWADSLHCFDCHTDRHLVIESIEALWPSVRGMVAVWYTCTACGHSRTHPATVPQIALILNRPGPEQISGILQFGGEYIHCGEPMHTAGSELRGIHTTLSTEQSSEDVLDVYLRTRVLHCVCGFQMEIPE
ncbi:hypothetical protein [Arthrobacter sp. ISL-28]|uniref:hypothetical protein n=1 Tax=Arthrobacter sp. ISL-28 TaxID=2819108 RepID=UPI001BE84BED|nr:hypothetical protein [Arthrobacter sp. ISL-28]MBT2521174.1 hypothetical protein [Arthrobacter sp. ISL-28]